MFALQWIRLRYWFLDSENKYSDVNFYLGESQVGGDWSKATAFGDALGDILQDLSQCNLKSWDLILYWMQSVNFYALTTPLYNHGAFILETTAGTRVIVQVPAFDDTKLDSDGITILTTDTDVQAFRGMLLNGDGTVAPSFEGDDLNQLNTAYLQARAISTTPVAG
jgi:hypothetical protein